MKNKIFADYPGGDVWRVDLTEGGERDPAGMEKQSSRWYFLVDGSLEVEWAWLKLSYYYF